MPIADGTTSAGDRCWSLRLAVRGACLGCSASPTLARFPKSALAGLATLAAWAAPAAAQEGPAKVSPEGAGAGTTGRAAAHASAPTEKALYQDGHRGRFLLNGAWYFRLDPQDQGLAQGLQRQVSLDGYAPVQVPYAWNANDISDQSQRGTVGWYRKDFRLPRGRATAWVVRFESVNYRAIVFLNGREIGRNEGAYIPFEVRLWRPSRRGVNRLVIRVDNRRTENDLPPGRDQTNGRPGGGWWNFGGLLREVYLRRVDRIDIEELSARPILPCRACDATVVLRARLRNHGARTLRTRLRASIDGVRTRSSEVRIKRGHRREVFARVRIPNPRLWEPGSPELYAVNAAASIRRRAVARYSTHIGIRSIKVDGLGRMQLNGRKVALRGASIHEDVPGVGAALSPVQRREMFGYLLDLGATITRAHYPLHPHFLEMADRAGVLVWDQIPFYQVRDEAINQRSVQQKGFSYLERTIRRDQNHASVFAWSIANELGSRITSGQQRYINGAVALAHRLDPARLVAIDFAGYPSVPPLEAYRQLDALGVNSYFGWYPGPNGQIVDRVELGPFLDQLHDYYPTEALFVTEFGAEANRSGAIDEKGTFEFQRDLLQHHVSTYDSKPYLGGAVAWILRDFKVRPDWDGGNPKPGPPYNQKGLVDEFGRKKPAFEETARLYRNVETLR